MADHKRKKKRGRSKLFTSCFRPFANRRRLLNEKSDCRNTRNGRLGKPVTDREEKDFVPDSKPVNDCVTGSGGDCPVKRSGHRRSVSRLLKAVLFDSVMVKKIGSSSKSSTASHTNESFESKKRTVKQSDDSNVCRKESQSADIEDSSDRYSNLLSSSSRASSSTNSSSSSSSMNSNSQWLSEQKPSSSVDIVDSNHPISSISSTLQKPIISTSSRSCFVQKLSSPSDLNYPKPKRTNSNPQLASHHKLLSQSQLDLVDLSNLVSSNCDKIKSSFDNWNIRWCLLLLTSLVVLVMYGRIYSILCTSIWFYLVPCKRLKRVNSATNTTLFMDTESEQYKKRVIMAGLLDRTRNPLR